MEANHQSQPIKGTCMTMCPNNELRLRQRENLVHVLECKVNEKGQRLGFGDLRRMVKEFSRSAAGHKIKASDVRSLPVLQKTVKYLISSVCSVEDVSWRQIYEFVSDRLRSVRQDITVQGLTGQGVVQLLTPMARFHVYAHYRLCEYDVTEFDPLLNLKHLNDTLLALLQIFKDNQYKMDLDTVDYGLKLKEALARTRDNAADDNGDNDENLSDDDQCRGDSCSDNVQSLIDSVRLLGDNSNGVNHFRTSDNDDNDPTTERDNGTSCTPAMNNETQPKPNNNSYTNIHCNHDSTDNVDNDEPDNDYNDIITKMSNIALSRDTRDGGDLRKYTVLEEMISLYLLIHIGNPEVLLLVFNMPDSVRKSLLVSRVSTASHSWVDGNHCPLVRLSHHVTPILAMALHLHLNKIQRHALGVLSVGHNSKLLEYNAENLREHLLFSSAESVLKACQYYGLHTTPTGVQFQKGSFKWDTPPAGPEKSDWVEEKSKHFTIPEMILD